MRKALLIILLIAGCAKPVRKPQIAPDVMAKRASEDNMKKEQFLLMRFFKCKDSWWAYDYWLSTEPNLMACDLNRDGIVNFFDFAEYLKTYAD